MGRQRAQRWRLWSGCCERLVLWEPNGDGIPNDEGWHSGEARALHVRRSRGLQTWLQCELGEPVDLDVSAMRVGW